MKVVTLEIADDFYDKFSHFLEAFPAGKVKLQKGSIETEIKNRITAIDNGSEKLTPYNDGLDQIKNKLQKKYANS
jgi:hypothetical protein